MSQQGGNSPAYSPFAFFGTSGNTVPLEGDNTQGLRREPCFERYWPHARDGLEQSESCAPIQESWERHDPEIRESMIKNQGLPSRHILVCGHETIMMNEACSTNCAPGARGACLNPNPATCNFCGTGDFTSVYWQCVLRSRRSALQLNRTLFAEDRDWAEQHSSQQIVSDRTFIFETEHPRIIAIYVEMESMGMEVVARFCEGVIAGRYGPYSNPTAVPENLPEAIRDMDGYFGESPADNMGLANFRWAENVEGEPQDWVSYRTLPDFCYSNAVGHFYDWRSDTEAPVSVESRSMGMPENHQAPRLVVLPIADAMEIKGRTAMLNTFGGKERALFMVKKFMDSEFGKLFEAIARFEPDRKNRAESFCTFILEPAIQKAKQEQVEEQLAALRQEEERQEAAELQTRMELISFLQTVRYIGAGYYDTLGDHPVPADDDGWEQCSDDDLYYMLNYAPKTLDSELSSDLLPVFAFLREFMNHGEVFSIPGEPGTNYTALGLVREFDRRNGCRLDEWRSSDLWHFHNLFAGQVFYIRVNEDRFDLAFQEFGPPQEDEGVDQSDS